jgi:hypothetical protein
VVRAVDVVVVVVVQNASVRVEAAAVDGGHRDAVVVSGGGDLEYMC